MVVLKTPLGSQRASGSLAGVLTFREAQARHVAGIKSNPKQPRTLAQRATRIWMAWLSKQWSTLSFLQKRTWLNYADSPLLSPYHAYIRYNTRRWITQPGDATFPDEFHFAPSIEYPASEAALQSDRINQTTGAGPGYIWHKFQVQWNTNCWNHAYHLFTPAKPQPVASNLVHVETVDHDGWFEVRIPNLTPGLVKLRWSWNANTGKSNHWYRTITETVT